MSFAVTLQPSNVSDFKFFRVFKWRTPELVIREFETFKETNPIKPAFTRKGVRINRRKPLIRETICQQGIDRGKINIHKKMYPHIALMNISGLSESLTGYSVPSKQCNLRLETLSYLTNIV
jgi:hypothetical protein